MRQRQSIHIVVGVFKNIQPVLTISTGQRESFIGTAACQGISVYGCIGHGNLELYLRGASLITYHHISFGSVGCVNGNGIVSISQCAGSLRNQTFLDSGALLAGRSVILGAFAL